MRVRLTASRSAYVRVHDPARLRENRTQKHLTMSQVADLIGVDTSYICKLELGQARTTSPLTARRLILLYGPVLKFSDVFTEIETAHGRAA